MTGDEYRTTVKNQAVFDALASGRVTWWPQTSVNDQQLQRGDTIVFHMSAATLRGRGGEQSPQLRMVVTDAQDLTMTLPIGGSEQTGDVFVARILSLRPADTDGGSR